MELQDLMGDKHINGNSPSLEQAFEAFSHTFKDLDSFASVYHRSNVGQSRALLFLDYQVLDKFVIEALLNLPVSAYDDYDEIYQANLAFLPVSVPRSLDLINILTIIKHYMREVMISIMYIRGCPIEQGTISEILSPDEIDQIVKYIIHKLHVFFKLKNKYGALTTLHNSYILINRLMQKFSLEIARLIKKSDVENSPNSVRKNYNLVTSTREYILNKGVDTPFIGQEWILSTKATARTFGSIGKIKKRYITIQQKDGPRSLLFKKNLWDDTNVNQVDTLHRDISRILTAFNTPVFERFQIGRVVSRAGAHDKDISFIMDLTRLYSTVPKFDNQEL